MESGLPKARGQVDERVAELERERELLNAIANYAPSMLCIVDSEGRVRPFAANKAFEATLGYEPHETGGELFWRRYVPESERDVVRDALLQVIESDEAGSWDGHWLAKDGTIVDVAWSATPLPMIASGPIFLVSATDMTERNRNAAEVRRSRARIVAAADEARKRLERNLHDGAQQRLIALLLSLRAARRDLGDDPRLESWISELGAAVAELRELAQGLHPASLTGQGLAAAVRAAAARTPLAVDLQLTSERYEPNVEAAAYYVVSEALANVAKHAEASRAQITIAERDGALRVEVADDGRGTVDTSLGTGLTGLADRVAALDGTFDVESAPRRGTTIRAAIPLRYRFTDDMSA
jgi:PAS domain S-box-containing protein